MDSAPNSLPPAPDNYTWTPEDLALLQTRNTLPQVPVGTAFPLIGNMICFSNIADELLHAQNPHPEQRAETLASLPDYVKRSVLGARMKAQLDVACPWVEELRPRYQTGQHRVTVILTPSTRSQELVDCRPQSRRLA
jgi:hypothetical protein